jgi:long-chain acyl-CoA synthetase
MQTAVYSKGGSVGFFRGDIRGLVDDIQALRPTILPVVPRVLNRVYDKVSARKKFIFQIFFIKI